MTRGRVRFHRAARVEAEAAARWYEEREEGLGDDFVTEVERAVEELADSPNRWPVSQQDPRARCFLLARFPYAIIYVVREDSDIIVAAVARGDQSHGLTIQHVGSLH